METNSPLSSCVGSLIASWLTDLNEESNFDADGVVSYVDQQNAFWTSYT